MKYTLATIAALASVALAKPAFLNTEFDLTEGKPYTIRYSGCDDGCTIILQNGPSDDLSDYKTLTTSATGDSFTFTPSELPSDTYNFKITDKAGEVNYSAQFPYKGSYAAPSVTKSATATAETTAAVSTKEATTLASVTKSAEETTTSKIEELRSSTSMDDERDMEESELLSCISEIVMLAMLMSPRNQLRDLSQVYVRCGGMLFQIKRQDRRRDTQ
ncbi:Uncharacterized protein Y057_14715 [Fusarium fujikuroi]|nr:Uncharacterized protein Y057_14715 [Fusarium fujikuroi]